jgi:hypothetical protein
MDQLFALGLISTTLKIPDQLLTSYLAPARLAHGAEMRRADAARVHTAQGAGASGRTPVRSVTIANLGNRR